MIDKCGQSPSENAVALANEFLGRVWGISHDLEAIDELMTVDFNLTSGGKLVEGRQAFKDWVRHFQTLYGNATTEILETFANVEGDRVVSRWLNTGINNGIFGFAADGRAISFTGIAIWRVQSGRLAECWVERAGLEAYQSLTRRGTS